VPPSSAASMPLPPTSPNPSALKGRGEYYRPRCVNAVGPRGRRGRGPRSGRVRWGRLGPPRRVVLQ
jgi:hypothetical protein